MKKSAGSICKLIEKVLSDNKAKNICRIDIRGKSSIAEFMIICSGNSNRHVISLSNYVMEMLKKKNLNTLSIEGKRNGNWVLLDAGDVIVHLFKNEVRDYYSLEKMWSADEAGSIRKT